MDIVLYKDDLVKWKQNLRGEEITLNDFCVNRSILYKARKITFIDGCVPFVLKDRDSNE